MIYTSCLIFVKHKSIHNLCNMNFFIKTPIKLIGSPCRGRQIGDANKNQISVHLSITIFIYIIVYRKTTIFLI